MDKERLFQEYLDEILNQGARNEKLRTAMDRAIDSYRKNTATALTEFPHTKALAEEVRRIKDDAISRMEELVQRAAEAVERNKGKAYIAKDKDEAIEIISRIVGEPKKVIVKAKSLTGEEIHIRQELQKLGHEVYETDLGEFLVQLRDSRPMHLLSPSIDLPREEAARLVGEFLGKEIPPDIGETVRAVKEFLRQKYFEADVGMSGANVVSADTGTIFVIENEGNARLSVGLQPVQITLVGFEKVVPSLHDAFKVAEVTWRFANYRIPSYVNMISGPSKTGDIEKVTTYGAHGPRELHVVFLDNGRTKMAEDPVMRQALRCLRCGGCLYECPVFAVAAGHFGRQYLGGIGIPWDAYVALSEGEASPAAYTCTLCGRCKLRCPMEIDVPRMVRELRARLVEKGLEPPHLKDFVGDIVKSVFGEA